jgi:tetratricopeptide (TPR) repeat protein
MDGLSKKAWEIFNQILAMDPECTMALEGRAMVNYYMKNYFNALTDITKALELEPSNPEFLTNKGLILQAMNDYTKAFNHYQVHLLCIRFIVDGHQS